MVTRIAVLATVVAIVLGLAVAPGNGARGTDPGITPTSIHLGGTFPLTGFAALYGTIPRASQAYYSWYFSHNKIHGRTINFTYLDDAYDPSQTVPQTQKLVEQDHVFAIVGSLGTATQLAVRPYLNQRKVPQVLLATGDPFWFLDYKKYPWTIGGIPTYSGEANLMAGYIKSKTPRAKIGILYQNDAYGAPYLASLKRYLGGKGRAKVVDAEPFDVTAPDVTQQMLKLKSSGANLFYDIATPLISIKALVTATKIGWKPSTTIVNAVSASTLFMTISAKSGANIGGVISSAAGPNPGDPANAGLPIVKLYKSIMARYYPKGDVTDPNNFASMAGAWLTIYALQRAGNPPTRQGFINALTHLDVRNDPFLYPGYHIKTTPKQRFIYDQLRLIRWIGGVSGLFKPFGPLVGGLRG